MEHETPKPRRVRKPPPPRVTPTQRLLLRDIRDSRQRGLPLEGLSLKSAAALVRHGLCERKPQFERTFVITAKGREYLKERGL